MFSSFDKVDEPSSKALKVGEVSSVPLSETLEYADFKSLKSSLAISIFSSIKDLKSSNSFSE